MTTQQDIFNNYFGKREVSKTEVEIVNTPSVPSMNENIIGQRADGNVDIFGFANSVSEMLTNAWEDGWGKFTINGVKKDNIENLPLPLIVFDVVERIPSLKIKGLKPRITEVGVDPDDDDYSIIVHRKWFDAIVEFLVLDTTNREAVRLADRFELFIDTYTGFFKETGVSELIFYKEIDSRLSKNYIEDVPSRCLQYKLVIERIVVERVRTTKEVRSKLQALSSNRG